MPRLTVATCQFPVDADAERNCRHVMRQMRFARERGADIAHFPEACLSGYAGADFDSCSGLDWELLETLTRRVMQLAGELGLWVVLGSTHPLTGDHKPHNSLYIIDSYGSLVDRYDKRFCAGDSEGRTGDLAHYTPGDHSSVFTVGGVRCGALICHDYRYPELYRDYGRQGVRLVFHSYHAAHMSPARVAGIGAELGEDLRHLNPGGTFTYPGITMPAIDDRRGGCQPHVDQRSELLGPRELLGVLLRPRGRCHHRPAAAQPDRGADLHPRHRGTALRLHRGLA
ncbi:MAG TPA: carbon-nitrogen hydrolase family protein [Streptomyces sp.]|jgi:hypothetical protein|nr:carbon-nitrogen hydrolase family protein [Streptomyces sp.]